MNGSTMTLASPGLDHIIERPRLIKLIEEADARVTLLAAPAGYGKTTLAKQWSARQTGPVAWYRTTRASGDVGALAVGLDKALAKAVPVAARDLGWIESIASVNSHPASLARALASAYSQLGPEVLLILDEWEAAGTEEADDMVSRLLEETELRMLVTTRTRPPWFTSRYEIYGAGLEVGPDQLAMTDAEVLAVLARDPDAPDTKKFLLTADGWPAVVGLAAVTKLSMLGDQRRMSRTLYDYFANELLATVDSDVHRAVTLVAIASIGSTTEAELILGPHSRPLLSAAARCGLLTVDDDSLTIHPLLRELLIDGVRRAGASERAALAELLLPLVHAQKWDEALAAAEVIQDSHFTSEALQTAIETLVRLQRVTTIERWAQVGRTVNADTALVDYAQSEVSLRRADFDRALMLAARSSAKLTGDRAAIAHLVAGRAAHLGNQGDLCDGHIDSALALAERRTTVASAHWLRYVRALEVEREDTAQLLTDFKESTDGSTEDLIRTAHGDLTIGHLEGGLLRRIRNGRAALALLTADVDPMVRGAYLNGLSSTMGDCGLFDESLEIADLEAALAEDYDLEFLTNFALTNRARAFIGMRRFALAKRSLSKLLRRANAMADAYARGQHINLQAALFLSVGDSKRAYAAVALDPDPADGRVVAAELLANRALSLAAQGEGDALRAVADARGLSRSIGVRATTSLALALCSLGGGDKSAAAALVDEAIETDVSFPMLLALRSSPAFVEFLRGREEHRAFLGALLHRSRDAAIAKRLALQVPRSEVRSQELTPRELEIHGLIAQGMTNLEIARQLFISESTAKVHVRHILEKLGVRSRAEATRVWQEES